MENTDSKFDKLIAELRVTKPKIQNPEALTESIVKAIKRPKTNNIKTVVLWVRPILSMAALFLIGFFLFESYNTSNELNTRNFSETSVALKSVKTEKLSVRETIESKNVWQYIAETKRNQSINEKFKVSLINQAIGNKLNSTLLNN